MINLNLLPSVNFDEICQFKSDNLSNVIFRWTGVRQLRTASFVEKNLHLWMLRLRTQRQELKVEMEMICFRFAQVSQFCRSNASIARIRFRPKEGGLRISLREVIKKKTGKKRSGWPLGWENIFLPKYLRFYTSQKEIY